MKKRIIIPAGLRDVEAIEPLTKQLLGPPSDKAWVVEIREQRPQRSLSQNALLWSLYDQIIERGGAMMQGWGKGDLHSFFLIEHYGSETRSIFGHRRLVPVKHSSQLSKTEFSDHIDFIVTFMLGQGVILDLPESQDQLE